MSDYRGGHSPSEEDPLLHDLTSGDMAFPKDVYDHPERYLFGRGSTFAKESIDTVLRARGNPSLYVSIYRSMPSDVPQEINRGDWVALSRSYAEEHRSSNGESDWSVVSARVPASSIRSGGNDLIEWGYWGPSVSNQRVASNAKDMSGHAMVALYPDWKGVELAVDDGLPPDDLHVTILYLGKADQFDDDQRSAIADVINELSIECFADDFSINPEGATIAHLGPDDDKLAVSIKWDLEAQGNSTLAKFRERVEERLEDELGVTNASNFKDFVPHTTLTYLSPDEADEQYPEGPYQGQGQFGVGSVGVSFGKETDATMLDYRDRFQKKATTERASELYALEMSVRSGGTPKQIGKGGALLLMRKILSDHGYPTASQAFIAPPKGGDSSKSQIAYEKPDLFATSDYWIPGMGLSPRMEDEMTVIHECAHLIEIGPVTSAPYDKGEMHPQSFLDRYAGLIDTYASPLLANKFFRVVMGRGRRGSRISLSAVAASPTPSFEIAELHHNQGFEIEAFHPVSQEKMASARFITEGKDLTFIRASELPGWEGKGIHAKIAKELEGRGFKLSYDLTQSESDRMGIGQTIPI